MATASLLQIARYCDRLLRTAAINDYDGALNGLQASNAGRVTRIAAVVDASLATAKLAAAAGADLLLGHDGLFWNARHPWTGHNYELLRVLMENNLAVYSSHLPLDAHPRLGNNAQLCAALGFKNLKPFFYDKKQFLGFQTRTTLSLTELSRRLGHALARNPVMVPGGPSVCRRIGVVTGGAGRA